MTLRKSVSIILLFLLIWCTARGGTNTNINIDNSDTADSGSETIDAGDTAISNETANTLETSDTEKTDSITVVDTGSFLQIPIREIEIELTYDYTPESICMYLLSNSHDNPKNAESLIEHNARMIQVVVRDGKTQDVLYDRTFSIDHVGEGELAIVTDGKEYYLFESYCHEQMGYASYYGEVFDWRSGEKIIVDEFRADFLISTDAVCRSIEQGESITLRDDAIPDFKEKIKLWNYDSELLIACDTMNSLANIWGIQSVYVSLEENQYSLEDFFSSIWERTAEKYTVGTFDNIMGYSGFYIYDVTYPFPQGYFYALEDGSSLCIAENWGGLENDSYIIDINGDGDNELICNLTLGGDGVKHTIIYTKEGSEILCGYADDMLDQEYDDRGAGSEHSMYLPDENVVEVFYWKEDLQAFQSKKYEIDLNKIEFSPFGSQQ